MTYWVAKTVLIYSGKHITSGTVAAIDVAAWLTCVVHCNPLWSLDFAGVRLVYFRGSYWRPPLLYSLRF